MDVLAVGNLRKKSNQLVLVLFILSLLYTLSLFIAPMTLEPGTVTNLDGAANQVDYTEKWDELPTYHSAIYTFGDLNCHQKHYRSYHINGNQMPVDARSTGIFFGMTAGFLLMSFIQGKGQVKRTILGMLNLDHKMSEKKEWLVFISLGVISALPLILDGSIQLVMDYESFNEFRTFTGLLFGLGISVFISSLILSISPYSNQY